MADSPAGDGAKTEAPNAVQGPDTVAHHGDMNAEHCRDMTPDSVADADVGDIHAALASLPTDSLSGLDATLDHLTSAADLFDVPAFDYGSFDHE